MTTYLCKFIAPRGLVYGMEKIVAADDAAAISKADCLLARSIGGGYEILDGERLVSRVGYPRNRAAGSRAEMPPNGDSGATGAKMPGTVF